MGSASQDAHPTIPAHARGPPSGAPYGLGYGSVAQHGRAPATVGRMRVRSPPKPLRVNVTHANPVHHLPDRHGSDGGEACSSITATDPPARILFQPDARQRHPCRTSFDSFPGRRGSDGGGDGNINSPSEMPPACTKRPHWGRFLFSVQVRRDDHLQVGCDDLSTVKVVEFGHFYGYGVISSLMRSRRIISRRAPHEGGRKPSERKDG